MTLTFLNHDQEEHTVLFPTPVGPITLSKSNKIFLVKSMDRVSRNHDVSRPATNHKIITLLDHAILQVLLPSFFCHMGGNVA